MDVCMRVRAPLPFPLLADTQDKTIGRRALRISGPVSAANYWEARTAPLNLTGRFVYIQVGTRGGGGQAVLGKLRRGQLRMRSLASASTGRVLRGTEYIEVEIPAYVGTVLRGCVCWKRSVPLCVFSACAAFVEMA